ncbi:MAG: peptidoglycan-associated lipoprotein Pal [Acidobacteriota bacterium]
MRVTSHRLGVAVLIVVFGLLLSGCGEKKPPAVTPAPPPPAPEPAPAPAPPPQEPAQAGQWEAATPSPAVLTPEQLNRMGVLRTIFFDYDKSEIRSDQRSTLQANAQWLRENANVKILVEGHCDERGTREYNVALGDRRAAAAMDYLSSLGIPRARIETISYGEERPAVDGHNETAWSRNRRAELKIVAVSDNP